MGNRFLCFFWGGLHRSKSDSRKSVKKMNYEMLQPRISKDSNKMNNFCDEGGDYL